MQVLELQKESCDLKNALKAAVQERDSLSISSLTLQESLNQTLRKLKLQNENEKLLATKTETIKTLEEEVERLKRLLSDHLESSSAAENELTRKLSQLSLTLLPLKQSQENLLAELHRSLHAPDRVKDKEFGARGEDCGV